MISTQKQIVHLKSNFKMKQFLTQTKESRLKTFVSKKIWNR
jgi:hypothetical protein